VLILSYIMPDITMLALSGIGIALLGFILQLISIFFTGR
jgi:hypothetical protein